MPQNPPPALFRPFATSVHTVDRSPAHLLSCCTPGHPPIPPARDKPKWARLPRVILTIVALKSLPKTSRPSNCASNKIEPVPQKGSKIVFAGGLTKLTKARARRVGQRTGSAGKVSRCAGDNYAAPLPGFQQKKFMLQPYYRKAIQRIAQVGDAGIASAIASTTSDVRRGCNCETRKYSIRKRSAFKCSPQPGRLIQPGSTLLPGSAVLSSGSARVEIV